MSTYLKPISGFPSLQVKGWGHPTLAALSVLLVTAGLSTYPKPHPVLCSTNTTCCSLVCVPWGIPFYLEHILSLLFLSFSFAHLSHRVSKEPTLTCSFQTSSLGFYGNQCPPRQSTLPTALILYVSISLSPISLLVPSMF